MRNARGEIPIDTAKKQKSHKEILWTSIYQQTGQLRRNAQVSRNTVSRGIVKKKQSDKTDH